MNIEVKQQAILSEAGKRPHNEDFVYPSALAVAENMIAVPNLYIVCDGIGGLGKGDIASKLAAGNFAKYFHENPPTGRFTQTYINNALKFVEAAFDGYVQDFPNCWGMGVTVVLLFLDEYGAHFAWAGNCRGYHLRGASRLYRTDDHTEAAQLLAEGKITETEAMTHHRRFPLRSIQSNYPTQMELHFIPIAEIQNGDTFFLCTDGLLEAWRESELLNLLAKPQSLDVTNRELKDVCMSASGDNFASCLINVNKTDAVVAASPQVVEPIVLDTPLTEAPSIVANTSPVTPIVTPPVVNQVISPTPPINPTGTVAPPIVDEPSHGSSVSVPLAILGFFGLLAVIIGLIWYTSSPKTKSYTDYMALSEKSATAQNYDQAIAYLDSAMRVAGDDQMKIRSTNLKRNDLMDIKRKMDKEKIIADADKYMSFGRFPDLLHAQKRYQEAIQNYGDNGGLIQQKLEVLGSKIKKLQTDNAYNDMLSEIRHLCESGNALDAEVFITETRKLPISNDKLKTLGDLSKNCPTLASSGKVSTDPLADNSQSREIAAVEPSQIPVPTDNPKPTNPTNNSTTSTKSTTTNSNTAVARTRSLSSPEVVDKSKKAKKVNCMSESSALEKGKCLYEQKEFAKSREMLEAAKSINNIDGQAAYLLGYMYHAGLGGDKNPHRAMENAKISAKKEWSSGLVLCAKIMLANNPTPNDKIIAKGYLAQAANAGHKEAQSLLKTLK